MKKQNCESWLERDRQVIAPCQHLSYFPVVAQSYHNAEVTDMDGNQFIDFLSGASSMNFGGSHPAICQAIEQQMQQNIQYSNLYCCNPQPVELAERLVSVYPGGLPAKVAFGNCGSDANDAAIKFARAYTGRHKIISFYDGYHGSSYGAASLTTCTIHMRESMGPFLPEVYHFPFFGTDVDDAVCQRECLAEMKRAFSSWLSPREVAAMIIEPIQGDAGILPAHPIFMRQLYELCREYGILFIVEEVQQGLFRTGTWFSIEHYGIVPDGIILGKSLGGGLPLSAFIGRSEMMDCLPAPAHVFTLSGNALSCAAGCAVFDICQSADFQSLLKANIALAWQAAEELRQKHPQLVQFIRGIGLSMGIGIGCQQAYGTWAPDQDGTFKILFRAYELGLIVISLAANVLRIQPPLTIPTEQLRKGFDILDQAMCDYEAGRIPDSVLAYRAGW